MCRPLFTLAVLFAAAPSRAANPPFPEAPPRKAADGPLTREQLHARRLDEAKALYAFAVLRQRADRLPEARRALQDAIALDPLSAEPRRALAEVLLLLEKPGEALTHLRTAAELAPDEFAVWHLLARCHRARSEHRQAADASGRAADCARRAGDTGRQLDALREAADSSRDAGDHDAAAARWSDTATLISPGAGRADALEKQGRALRDARRWDEAAAALHAALEMVPDEPRVIRTLAEVEFARGAWSGCLKLCEDALRRDKGDAEARDRWAACLRELGRPGEAIDGLRTAARAAPDNAGLAFLLARELRLNRRTAEAERIYRDLVEAHGSPEAYGGWFDALDGLERHGEALAALDRQAKLVGESTTPADDRERAAARLRALSEALAARPPLALRLTAVALEARGDELADDTFRLLGDLAARSRDLASAARLYRQALEGAAGEREFRVYDGLVRVLWRARKPAEVEAVCRRGLDRAKNMNQVYFFYHLIQALAEQGKGAEALRVADRAARLANEPNKLLVRSRKVRVLSRLERHDEAAAECDALLAEYREPGPARDVRYAQAHALSARGDHRGAEACLRRILADHPDDATACNDLGYQLAEQGRNFDEAETLVRRAVELDRDKRRNGGDAEPDSAAYLDSLGWVLFRRGRPADALDWLERASRMDAGRDDPTVWDHLGDVLHALGRPAPARSAWQEAARLLAHPGASREERRHADEVARKLKLVD